MANIAYRGFLDPGGSGNAGASVPHADTVDTLVDAAKALTAALETDTIALDADVDATKVLSAALETDAIAADDLVDTAVAGEPDDTDVIAKIAVLQADGASPTEAHVNDLQASWDTFKTAFDLYNTAVGNVKTATAALETDTIAVDASVDGNKVLSAALETDAIAADDAVDLTVTASQAGQAGVTSGVLVQMDLTTVTDVGILRRIFNAIERAAVGGGMTG